MEEQVFYCLPGLCISSHGGAKEFGLGVKGVMMDGKARKLSGALSRPASVITVILVVAIVCVLMSIFSTETTSVKFGLIPLSRTVIQPADVQQEEWITVRMRVTAYCPCSKCCGKYSDGRTACNHKIRNGDTFVAADKRYNFGTELIVPGYNDYRPIKVMDRGRVIKGDRLDVFFHTHKRAMEWGVQYLDVKIRQS